MIFDSINASADVFLTFKGISLLNFWRTRRVPWVDLILIMLFVWSIHVRCWSKMTSNSFTFAFCWIDCPEERMKRLLSSSLCLKLSRDEENWIDWSLSQLSIRLFCYDQDSSFSTTFWIATAHSWSVEILQCRYRVVPSACWMGLEYVRSAGSATYKLNSTGPIILPWGTPKNIGNRADILASICTYR